EPQRRAIAAGEVAVAARAEEGGVARGADAFGEPRAMNLPALAVYVAEGTGKWRRDRAHQVVSLERRTRPVDATVLGSPPPEVLAGEDRLRPPWRCSGDERRK